MLGYDRCRARMRWSLPTAAGTACCPRAVNAPGRSARRARAPDAPGRTTRRARALDAPGRSARCARALPAPGRTTSTS